MLKPDIVKKKQDMRHLSWARARKSSGTAGSYLKSYSGAGDRKIYYKLSYYDPVKGITGHECVNELIVSRLLDVLGVEHLSYQLIHAAVKLDGREHETWLCASEDFKEKGDTKIAFDDYYELEKNNCENVIDFCERMGWDDCIYRMLVTDFLILNRDRHGANIEIISNPGRGTKRPAPLFDHGISLLYNCRSDEDVLRYDPMEDKPVQCFAGTGSAKDNLELIPPEKKPALRRLEERDRTVIFDGLDNVLSQEHLDGIWKMIKMRWDYYESL